MDVILGHNIERGRVREVFAELIRSTAPQELIAGRLRERPGAVGCASEAGAENAAVAA